MATIPDRDSSLEKGHVANEVHSHSPTDEKASSKEAEVLSVLDFAGDTELPPPPQLTKAQEKALYRKIDRRLMPILALMYLMSFLDRGVSLRRGGHAG